MRSSKTPAVLSTALLSIGALAGCVAGSTEDSSDDQQTSGTVEFWTINLKGNYEDYIQGLIDDYEAANDGVEIEWVDVPGGEINQKLLASLASGDVPDVVQLIDADLGSFGDALSDLTPFYSEDDLSAYLPTLVDSVRRQDALMAVPWIYGGAPTAWYNGQLLEQAGIAAADLPTTWDEAFEFGRRVKETTGLCGFSELPRVAVLQSEGVTVLNDDRTQATLNTPEAAAVLDKWREAYRAGAVCPGAVSEDIRNLPETLDNGLAAGVVGGVYGLPANLINTKNNAPEVYQHLVVSDAVQGAAGNYVIPGVNALAVPQGSDIKEVAADFILHVTSPDAQLEFCGLAPIFPSTTQTLEGSVFTDLDESDPQDAARKHAIDALPVVITQQIPAQLEDAYLKEIRAFMTSDVAATDTLATVEEAWNTLLAEQAG
ncbi:ABC transporter substrate-binding protein [Jiangella rhizosphaerae]|uniref:Extracellular solute-binding protein n=1 Tax=Jiangella rhizosphaerae TaxID=2293569 RepID=A0A418KM01_9ACTN|nr:extracellular solute-binding protein [Jiangella rhizosphaerae]RIQ18988.1 extracellular solute-binding protein [Jiangella rhizosphaerae]